MGPTAPECGGGDERDIAFAQDDVKMMLGMTASSHCAAIPLFLAAMTMRDFRPKSLGSAKARVIAIAERQMLHDAAVRWCQPPSRMWPLPCRFDKQQVCDKRHISDDSRHFESTCLREVNSDGDDYRLISP